MLCILLLRLAALARAAVANAVQRQIVPCDVRALHAGKQRLQRYLRPNVHHASALGADHVLMLLERVVEMVGISRNDNAPNQMIFRKLIEIAVHRRQADGRLPLPNLLIHLIRRRVNRRFFHCLPHKLSLSGIFHRVAPPSVTVLLKNRNRFHYLYTIRFQYRLSSISTCFLNCYFFPRRIFREIPRKLCYNKNYLLLHSETKEGLYAESRRFQPPHDGY